MNVPNDNPFLRFRLTTLIGIVFVGAIFSFLAQKFGVAVIRPWVFFAIFCATMFLIGRWLVNGINIAKQTDPTTPSEVASFEDSYEANLLVSKLKELGIHATLAGTFTSGFQAESPGLVTVFVSKENLLAAKQVIAELKANPIMD